MDKRINNMNKERISVLIADDHEIVRCGVKFLLEKKEKFLEIDEVSSFNTLLLYLENNSCDVLILDLNLGDNHGIETIRMISEKYRDLPILVLSMFPEDPYAIQSIQAGALGYLNKKMVSEFLIEAVETVMKKKIYFSQAYAETLPCDINLEKSEVSAIDSLSKREHEVYQLIASGLSSKEISEKLSLNPKTISTYRARISKKLSLSSRSKLLHFALQCSLKL